MGEHIETFPRPHGKAHDLADARQTAEGPCESREALRHFVHPFDDEADARDLVAGFPHERPNVVDQAVDLADQGAKFLLEDTKDGITAQDHAPDREQGQRESQRDDGDRADEHGEGPGRHGVELWDDAERKVNESIDFQTWEFL